MPASETPRLTEADLATIGERWMTWHVDARNRDVKHLLAEVRRLSAALAALAGDLDNARDHHVRASKYLEMAQRRLDHEP